MQGPIVAQVRDELRAVFWPDSHQPILAAGFVREIDVREDSVRIGFERRTRRTDRVAVLEEGVRRLVSPPPGVGTHRELSGRVASHRQKGD